LRVVSRRRSRRGGWAAPAFLGGAGLLVGAFAPLADVEYWGTITLHDAAPAQALLVAGAGAAAVVAALLGRAGWVGPAALLAWIGALLPFIQNWLAPEPSFLDQIGNAVVSTVSDQLGEVALQLVHPDWGCVPLALGLLLVSVAGWRAA
jgi:hypothetical protein